MSYLKEDVIAIVHEDFSSLSIIREVMGGFHTFFASMVEKIGGKVIDLYYSKELIGQSVVYSIDIGPCRLGVIYYMAILPRYRKRSFGRVLLASAEEALSMMDVNYFAATLKEDNKPAVRIFNSMAYKLYAWKDIAKLIGQDKMEMLRMGTCGYEDDFLALKKDLGEVNLLEISDFDHEKVKRIWEEICLKPWLEIKRSFS